MTTISKTATRWGISPQRVRKLASEGRIPGAIRIGRDWLIPKTATNPASTVGRPKKSPQQQ